MQAIAGKVESLRGCSLIEAARNVFYVLQQIRPNPTPVVAFKGKRPSNPIYEVRGLTAEVVG